MKTKLTLCIEKKVIIEARRRKLSISREVEEFLAKKVHVKLLKKKKFITYKRTKIPHYVAHTKKQVSKKSTSVGKKRGSWPF